MNRGARRRVTTSFLLVCAAIGVAGALLGAANRVLQTLTLGVAPLLLAIALPLAAFAPTIATHLLRRPGAALCTALVAGVVAMPFSPSGAGVFQALGAVLVGLVLEAPFAVLHYRRFPMLASLVAGLGVAALLSAVHWTLWGMSEMTTAVAVTMVALIGLGAMLWTALGTIVGRRLAALGVARTAARTAADHGALSSTPRAR